MGLVDKASANMSAAEDEEPAHGSASLRQHKTAGRAKQRQQLPAHEQAAIRAANTTAHAEQRARKKRGEQEAGLLQRSSAAKQRRVPGNPAEVCRFEDNTFIWVFSFRFNESFCLK